MRRGMWKPRFDMQLIDWRAFVGRKSNIGRESLTTVWMVASTAAVVNGNGEDEDVEKRQREQILGINAAGGWWFMCGGRTEASFRLQDCRSAQPPHFTEPSLSRRILRERFVCGDDEYTAISSIFYHVIVRRE